MTNNNNQVSVTYTDAQLRNLVEEYITQQKTDFTFKGVCAYILYWAMEDGNVVNAQSTLCEGNKLQTADQDRIHHALDTIIKDGRIIATEGETRFVKSRC